MKDFFDVVNTSFLTLSMSNFVK